MATRVTDAILKNKAFNQHNVPMSNPIYGGQNGWAPNFKEFVNNTPYVARNLVVKVLTVPKFFSAMPNPEIWTATLVSMFETHAERIEGLNAGITLETEEVKIGRNEVMEEPIGATRARSQVTLSLSEKYGRPFQTFIENYITYGIMDPDTTYALSGTLDNYPSDMLADQYTFSCIFFEPDATHRRVMKAWLGAGMYFKNTGDIVAKRSIEDNMEALKLDIELAGFYQYGNGPREVAQTLLDGFNHKGANPYNTPAFIKQASADVAAAPKTYEQTILDTGDK